MISSGEQAHTILTTAVRFVPDRFFDRPENSFASELYHQLRIAIGSESTEEVTVDLIKEEKKFTDELLKDKFITKYMPLGSAPQTDTFYTLQASIYIQEYLNFRGQLLAIEVRKMESPNDAFLVAVKSDLAKLAFLSRCNSGLKSDTRFCTFDRATLIVYTSKVYSGIQFCKALERDKEIYAFLKKHNNIELLLFYLEPSGVGAHLMDRTMVYTRKLLDL